MVIYAISMPGTNVLLQWVFPISNWFLNAGFYFFFQQEVITSIVISISTRFVVTYLVKIDPIQGCFGQPYPQLFFLNPSQFLLNPSHLTRSLMDTEPPILLKYT